jgi:HSP20 family protein
MAEPATKMPVTKTTASAKRDERRPLESLRREIDQFFESFHPFDWRLPSSVLGFDVPRISREEWPVLPAMDLVEKTDAYEITAELPGIDEKNVEIKLSNHTLTIKGEKQEEKEEGLLPLRAPLRLIPASRRGGHRQDRRRLFKSVLTVKLPKTAQAKQAEKTIAVKAA